jgi:hypothetical protein
MKKYILLLILFVSTQVNSQVGIGTKTPHSSAMLELSSSSKGFLSSRIALTGKTDVATIASPAIGLLIYNTATAGTSPNNVSPGYYYYDGTAWVGLIENSPFYLNNSTADAGNNKNTSVYRNGNLGINQSVPKFGIDVNNSQIRALNSSNSNQIFIDPIDALGPKIKFGTSSDSISFFEMGAYSGSNNIDNKSRDFKIFNNTNSNALVVKSSGYIGVGTNTPYSQFSNTSNAIQGTNNISSINGGFTWSSLGSGFSGSFYGQQPASGGLLVKVAGTSDTVYALQVGQSATQTGLPSPIISAMASGRVGVGVNYPLGRLVVNDVSYISSMPLSSSNLMDNSTFRPLSRFQTTNGANNNALSHYMTTTAVGTQAHNYSTGSSLPYVLQPTGGNMGIGVLSPTKTLEVGGEVKINTVTTGIASDSLLVINSGVIKKKSVSVNVNVQTADYTLAATDNGGVVIVNSATAVNITVPSSLSTGFFTQIIQKGAGQVTVVGASGVTVNSAFGTKTRAQFSAIGVVMETTAFGYVTGDTGF